ncbi:MAG: AraC family transcriptional regulator [Pseudomonadota bacterium]
MSEKQTYHFENPALASTVIGTDIVTRHPVLPVVVSRFSSGSHTSCISASSMTTLVVPGARTNGLLHAEIGSKRLETKTRPGQLTFAPANHSQFYDFDGETTNTVMCLDRSLFENVVRADVGFDSLGIFDPSLTIQSPRLERLVADYLEDALAEEPGWSLLAEAHALRIAIELFRVFGTPSRGARGASGAVLSVQDLGTIRAFVEANMGNAFSVSDLAALVGRDIFGFTRAFKKTTQQTPHSFVIQIRVLRARDLLSNTKLTLADIAYACGFSSQAHMTSTFTKHLGISPGRYRREVRS